MAHRRRQSSRKQALPAAPAAAGEALVSRREKLLWAALLLFAYGYIATWGQLDFSDLMGYYSLQADAFLQGRLYLDRDPGQGYIMDLIPFEGHYYLQWGPFPAVLHLIPKLLGVNLSDRVACILAGWLTCLVFLEIILWLGRRYFDAVPCWIFRWFFFTFAFGTPTVVVALRGTIYHESIAWAVLFVLAGFWAFLRYVEASSRKWVLLAGLFIAFAVATRVMLAVYAAGLFAGLAALHYQWKRPLRQAAGHLALFSLPVVVSGLLMMAYNQARFHSPWEYGRTYLPSEDPTKPAYALNRVPENFRHYVLAPIRLSREFPWLQHEGWKPLERTERAEDMSSLLLASPFLLLGFQAWRVFRSREERLAPLRIFAAVAAGSAVAVFFSLLCFVGTSRRYMQDFVPMLMLLAFLGVASRPRPEVEWRRWRQPGWVVFVFSALIHVHLVFCQPITWPPIDSNVNKTFVAWSPVVRRFFPSRGLDTRDAIDHNDLGIMYMEQGQYAEAVRHFERAAQLDPGSPGIQYNLRLAKEMQARRGR